MCRRRCRRRKGCVSPITITNKITARAVAEYANTLYSPASKHALIKTVEQIMPDNIDEIAAKYKTIKAPMLVLWCKDDTKVVPAIFGAAAQSGHHPFGACCLRSLWAYAPGREARGYNVGDRGVSCPQRKLRIASCCRYGGIWWLAFSIRALR